MRRLWLLAIVATALAGCRAYDADTGSLGFVSSAVVAVEGSTATLTVARGGVGTGAASVRYATADGSAEAASDYTVTSGTLQWVRGDTADKTITIPITADGHFEEDETLTVSLSNARGANLGASAAATVTIADNDPVPLQLLAFNDFHGNLNPPGGTIRAPDPADPSKTVSLPAGGVEYLGTLVKQLKARNPRTTVVAAGDLIGASPLVSSLFHDEPTVESLNQLGLEYSSVGNHEFDDGSSELLRMQNGGCFAAEDASTCQNGPFNGAAFRYLAANVVNRKNGSTIFPAYAIKSFDVGAGRRIGVAFIGLVLRNTPNIVTPSGVEGLSFTDEAGAANALVPELKAAGVEAIVVLIHEGGVTTGLYNDKSCPGLSGDILPIVDKLDPAIDIVISGHTHAAYNCVRNGRVLASASSFGRVLTDIDFTLDRGTRDIVVGSVDNRVVVNDFAPNPAPAAYPSLAKDPDQIRIVSRYNHLVAPLANRVIGRITADLRRTPNTAGESALGDVIADSQLAATAAPKSGGAVVAFMNGGGIRSDLAYSEIGGSEAEGEVTYGEASAVEPYGNTLTTITLSGAQIRTLLEQQFPPTQTAPKLLQVSRGFTYTYDANGPDNARVDPASIRINGVVVKPRADYRVTINNFMAAGGDNYFILKQGRKPRGGVLDLDALMVYFQAHSPIAPEAHERIKRLN
ncbi:MAG: bifunctional metallophosphatase/5-nucleotidase [Hydrocarboniphaga sp.]|uniref:5'-nucleotidase C-terminal domain-containing protein n=1 Tax=Hydrocarboniphaga sp. TaxID=2033016 RepID=UPI002609E8F5|nr:5'-nucleotidase C-terminal domain-containing protein [Hydrocarboniphaga sp.]MDB5971282.1 bifunctional metallophosphatase/5-nucleotidase [Hydrocarboniphaga sp.]